MSTRIYLIRHGVTASNREQRYMGRSEESLSNDGRWQARQLALRLAPRRIEALYCSPLRRARETAEIIGQPHGLTPRSLPAFNELDLSRWQGLTPEEIGVRDADAWETWCDDPARLRLPGIEPFPELRERVRRGLNQLVGDHEGDDIAVVTHDGIVRIAVLEAIGMSDGRYRAIPVDNTGLTILHFTSTRTYLRALNDTGHLSATTEGAVSGPADR